MENFRRYAGNLALTIVLLVHLNGFRSNSPTVPHQETSNTSAPTTSSLQQKECGSTFEAQEIPDDGSWLTICWSDPMAPEGSTVTKVHIKYLFDHPKPEQLEIRLSREETSPGEVVWDRGVLVQGDKFGEAVDLGIFNGTPSQGNWYFQIRDTKPGDVGKFDAFTIRSVYAPLEPALEILSGSPGEPTSFRIPPEAARVTTPNMEPEKPVDEQNHIQPVQHINIKNETFEGAFVNTGWAVVDNYPYDGKNYLWDDDDFRPHNGFWAAWPANGGTNGLDPASNPYPPNMSSSMIYGPFDLSNAGSAEVTFWLWRISEPNYDVISFGISHDGVNFGTASSWSGTSGWQQIQISLNNYVGDSSVWVSWNFISDVSIQYEGPWVDDIVISKEVPGTVTPTGTLSYYDRDGSLKTAPFTKVSLYDQDPGGTNDLLATTYTNSSGVFSFSTMTNWDGDADADPINRNLDLYVVFEALNYDLYPTYHQVTNLAGQTQKWYSSTSTNAPDGTLNKSTTITSSAKTAMWIFQDLRRAWETIYNGTSPSINPGSVTAKWEVGVDCLNYCYAYMASDGSYIFIPDSTAISADTVVHETSHKFLYNASTWYGSCPSPHYVFGSYNVQCAWSEGWADFLPLVVNGDTCYDFGMGPCSGNYGSPVINGKEPNHEGHKVHKGGKGDWILQAFFLRDLCVLCGEKWFSR